MEAITIFKDNVNAFIAQRMLDGFNLDDPRVTLDVKFVQERLEEEEVKGYDLTQLCLGHSEDRVHISLQI
jgi:hypothetical protein